ncbi:MAG TPA: retropepsin-like aspartic protease, partial [Fimbriimonadaceae bacterium]|nr:retropepsin-like aspartic protease [Fimbriimonadaceae bacterium]
TVERAEPATVEDTEFRLPNVSEDGATFDPAVASAIEVKHLFGYFFVHPLVDGKDVGWFFLDTGAGAMVLDIEAAKGLSVKPVGSRTVAGVVATIQTPIVRGSEFKLGPVSIAHPTFLELDVSSIGRMFNLKLGGICGYDFISRASLEIDARTPSIKVFPPGKAVLPASSSWTGFDFTANLMCLKCRFEGGHEGYFTLDTGSGSAVDFTAPTVEKFDLLKDRQTTPTRVGGAGGVTAAKQGRLDWIEVAGNRVANVLAGFQTTKAGVYASPYLAGNLGAGVLGRFDLLLDYRNQRLALVPFAPAKATATGG